MSKKPSANPEAQSTHGDEPVLTLIKKIKENSLDPVLLKPEDRRRCVEVLWGEGCSVAETAQILKCGERTIYRDRTEIRSAHALQTHPQFASQMAGELMRQAETSVGRLRRIAREPGASAMERCIAESAAFKAHLDMITKLQSMGYLPRVPTGVVAHVTGPGVDVIPTYDELAERLRELSIVDQEQGRLDPETQQQRESLEDLVRRGRMAAEIVQHFHPPASEN